MSTLITVLHVIVCLFLMLTVLLQQGKGGGMGGAFGGSNAGSVFGGSGASSFLRRLTAIAATVFMLTSMTLAFLASRNAGDSLEKYSKSEAARKKREREAELKASELSGDAGVSPANPAGDAGVGTTPSPVTPGGDDSATGAGTGTAASGSVEPVIPVEVGPADGSATPAPGTPAPGAPAPAPSMGTTPTPAPPAPAPSAPGGAATPTPSTPSPAGP